MNRSRYLARRAKLAALAERGVDGERDNARRMLAELDAKHPEHQAPTMQQRDGAVHIHFTPEAIDVLARIFARACVDGMFRKR